MSDLTEFLLARIAEDEEVARDAAQRPKEADAVRIVWYRHDTGWTPSAHGEWAEGQALFDRFEAARVLAECEAKRRIVARQPRLSAPDDVRDVWWDLVALLALPYADHPEYDEAWRP